MIINNDLLKESAKRISSVYKKNSQVAAARYITIAVSPLKLIDGTDSDYHRFSIMASNMEEKIYEGISISNISMDSNIKGFHFPKKIEIAVYGEMLLDIIEKNSSNFIFSVNEEEQKLLIESDGKYEISYVTGISHSISYASISTHAFSATIENEKFMEMISILSEYQHKGTTYNNITSGINIEITHEEGNPACLRMSSTNGIVVAETENHNINSDGEIKVKFNSKSLLPFLKGIEKDSEIEIEFYENFMIIKELSANEISHSKEIYIPFLINFTDLKAIISKYYKESLTNNSLTFSVDSDTFSLWLNKTLYNILSDSRIELIFKENFIEIVMKETGFSSNLSLYYIPNNDDIIGKRIILSADMLSKLLKNIPKESIWSILPNGLFIDYNDTEKITKTFIILSMR